MRTEDFTRVPLGSLVSLARTVIRCPLCRRHGVLESDRDGARRCVHVEISTLSGTAAEATDRCELARPRAVLPAGMVLRAADRG
ncbi:MAG: hypothetical protein ABI968_00350 [Acidobacteriota bacterium]